MISLVTKLVPAEFSDHIIISNYFKGSMNFKIIMITQIPRGIDGKPIICKYLINYTLNFNFPINIYYIISC